MLLRLAAIGLIVLISCKDHDEADSLSIINQPVEIFYENRGFNSLSSLTAFEDRLYFITGNSPETNGRILASVDSIGETILIHDSISNDFASYLSIKASEDHLFTIEFQESFTLLAEVLPENNFSKQSIYQINADYADIKIQEMDFPFLLLSGQQGCETFVRELNYNTRDIQNLYVGNCTNGVSSTFLTEAFPGIELRTITFDTTFIDPDTGLETTTTIIQDIVDPFLLLGMNSNAIDGVGNLKKYSFYESSTSTLVPSNEALGTDVSSIVVTEIEDRTFICYNNYNGFSATFNSLDAQTGLVRTIEEFNGYWIGEPLVYANSIYLTTIRGIFRFDQLSGSITTILQIDDRIAPSQYVNFIASGVTSDGHYGYCGVTTYYNTSFIVRFPLS